MSIRKLGVLVLFAFLLGELSAPQARANTWNQQTKITFNEPVEIPGMVLPAGTYTFTLMNDDVDRDVVQVWNKDRMHLFATILAIPDYRLHPTGKPVITFEERTRQAPEALHAWFYPGDNYGHEFVYPRNKAMELAKRTGQPILSMSNEAAKNITTPVKSAKEPSVVAMKHEHVMQVKPNGQEVEMAQNVPPPMPTPAPKALPKTASTLPLWTGLGILFLAAGLSLRLALCRMS